jgi:hypothetical protein
LARTPPVGLAGILAGRMPESRKNLMILRGSGGEEGNQIRSKIN